MVCAENVLTVNSTFQLGEEPARHGEVNLRGLAFRKGGTVTDYSMQLAVRRRASVPENIQVEKADMPATH